MKLAILEIGSKNHYVYLESLIEILSEYFEIYIYTKKETFSLLKMETKSIKNVHFVIKQKSDSAFLEQVKRDIKKQNVDILLITTLQVKIFKYLFFSTKAKTFVTIHNLNAWFDKGKHISIKYRIKRLIRKIILYKIDGICVLEESLKSYLLDNNLYNKDILVTPFMLYPDDKNMIDRNTNNVHSDLVKFVIPGQIDVNRRNYERIIMAIEYLDNYKGNFSVTLLGRPVEEQGKKIIEKCKQLNRKGYKINIFNEFISDSEYSKIMSESDFIIADLVDNVVFDGFIEYYGKTKSTGVFFNIIQYGLPAIINNGINYDGIISNTVITFESSKNLIDILQDIIVSDKQEIIRLKDEARKNSINFSLTNKNRLIEHIKAFQKNK